MTTASPLLHRLVPNLTQPPLTSNLRGDATGALVGMLVSVPQSMAFGMIAGSALGGAWVGAGVLAALYGSVVQGLIAVTLGGCPVVISGPRAATSLVFAALLVHLLHAPALAGLADPVPLALALACGAVTLSGVLQAAMGMARLGRLANYIPYPVVAGFLNGSGLLILISQVWTITGIPRQDRLTDILGHLSEGRPLTLALALGTAGLILVAPRLVKKIPGSILGLGGGLLAYYLLAAFGLGQDAGGTMSALPEHSAISFTGATAF